MSEVEGDIYQMRNRSNQDPLNFPIKVNNRLANLLFEVMVGRLEGVLGRLGGVWGEELLEVNEVLRGLGGVGWATSLGGGRVVS